MRRLPSAILAIALAACSSPTAWAPVPAARAGPPVSVHRAKGRLALRIRVPKKHRAYRVRVARHGKPAYISPATQGLTIALSGPTNVNQTVSLQPTASGCSSSLAGTFCTLTIPGLAPCPGEGNCYTATIATYDAVSCSTTCTIPGGANELSANQNLAFAIVAGATNDIAVTLGGIPTAVAIMPGTTSSLSGNMAGGFTLSKCLSSEQDDVLGIDADGNYILGPGAPTPALSSNDAHVTIATPAPAAPNRFTLQGAFASGTPSPSAIPTPGSGLQLTASVTPLAGSGGTVVQQTVGVTFDHTICGVITEYPTITGGSGPQGITAGPDGNLWFTECDVSKIGKITTAGVVTEYPTLTGNSEPQGITTGPDGNLWFTEYAASKIGKITTAGTVTEYSTLTAGSYPYGITAGPDGNLWFTEYAVSKIGRITTAGAVAEYPTITGMSSPRGIAAGPDGNLWFTEGYVDKIGKITTAGVVAEYPTITSYSDPWGITAGPDGNLWFAEWNVSKIGKITTAGTVTEYSTLTGNSAPRGIAAAPDGNLWFTEHTASSKIGKITTAGTVTEYSTPTFASYPQGITAGPDGNLWFTECAASKIGRMQ